MQPSHLLIVTRFLLNPLQLLAGLFIVTETCRSSLSITLFLVLITFFIAVSRRRISSRFQDGFGFDILNFLYPFLAGELLLAQ
ncbi:MAG: hypothetical protein AAGF24_06090 [Cyanobacteria bacterium P01_H01_bin.121]